MSKTIKHRKIVLPALAMVLMASQLTGCSSELQESMIAQLNSNQAIVIEVATPEDKTQGTELHFEWKELAYLDSYPNFRLAVEDAMGIVPFGTDGKNGIAYVDAVGKHTNNSVLRYAFMNKKFVNAWNGETVPRAFKAEAKKIYTDITNDNEALIAGLNAYYNIIDDGEPSYSNLYGTLNRLEAMSAMVKATTPVQEVNAEEFVNAIGIDNEMARIASLINNNVYISTNNKSLDNSTATGTMTRAEFIYMLVNTLYADDYKEIISQEKIENAGFSDAKCEEALAEKIGFIPEGGTVPERLESYLLSYTLQVEDNKLPKELYSALVVAKNKGLISSETRWSDGITKGEALSFIINTFAKQGTVFSADRGESTGEAVGSLEDSKNKTTVEECKQLWDPDTHCTYVSTNENNGETTIEGEENTEIVEDKVITIDDEMLNALNKFSKPYFKMDIEEINTKATLVLELYYESLITKDQWYDYLFGDIDLTDTIDDYYKAQEELNNNTESEEITKEDDVNQDLLDQWLSNQNKGSENNQTEENEE